MWGSSADLRLQKVSTEPSLCCTDLSDDDGSSSSSHEEGLECPICWESFNIVENVPYVLWCGHTLCQNCVLGLQWAVFKLPAQKVQLPFFVSCPWCHFLSFRLNGERAKSEFLLRGDSQQAMSPARSSLLGCSSNNHSHRRVQPTHFQGWLGSNLDNSHVTGNVIVERPQFSLHKSLDYFIRLAAKFPLHAVDTSCCPIGASALLAKTNRSGGTAGGRMGGGMLSAGFILLGSAKPPSSKVGASVTVGLLCGGFTDPASSSDGSSQKDGVFLTLGGLSVKDPWASSGTSTAKVNVIVVTLYLISEKKKGKKSFFDSRVLPAELLDVSPSSTIEGVLSGPFIFLSFTSSDSREVMANAAAATAAANSTSSPDSFRLIWPESCLRNHFLLLINIVDSTTSGGFLVNIYNFFLDEGLQTQGEERIRKKSTILPFKMGDMQCRKVMSHVAHLKGKVLRVSEIFDIPR
ncbi:hypothetical protein Cgig2_031312 [Carnegiea gigantea]|uniref:RING-type domain-containing protein n=1 Tax=Carnegiea gigantea TaxID=171969 RepID=A0A9Q1QKW0_9CARY|nr:hypothetical protein Cgig2_031312 [Carnegiea gigantea]